MTPIQQKINSLRESTGLKKGQFTKLIGKNPTTVERWMRADNPVIPDSLTIAGIEKIVSDFLSKKGKNKSK